MLGRIVPEQNPLDAVLAELESKGGWRVFMKDSSAIPQIDDRRLSEALMKDFPNAALAIPFYIAKMGDPMSARAQLNRCDGVLAQHFILNPKLCLERILIDAHISVYEDKVFKASDGSTIRWETWSV